MEQKITSNSSVQESRNPGIFADATYDVPFKRIFGTEKFKAATIGMLNSIIKHRHITDVTYINTELTPESVKGKKSLIDVLCKDETGARFIVEVQRSKQPWFRQRTVFYSSKVISLLDGNSGTSEYDLPESYVIAFLNFSFEEFEPDVDLTDRYMLHYVTMDDNRKIKLPGSPEYYFFDLERFDKNPENISDETDFWIYLLKESKTFEQVPQSFVGNDSFEAYFEASKVANFSKEEALDYEKEMMTERDIINGLNYAKAEARTKGLAEGKAEGKAEGRAEGKAEGFAEAKVEVARAMKARNLDYNLIQEITGLSLSEIEKL